MMIAFTLTLAFACLPVDTQWNPYETGGNCINRVFLWHVILSLSVITNVWILFMPLRMLLGLKVEKRQKIMIFCIFGCGAIATIASILALAELPLAINDPDKTWGSWRLAVYAAVENNFGIIAASAPALKPFIGRTARRIKNTVGTGLSTTLWNTKGGSADQLGTNKSKSKPVKFTNTTATTNVTEKQQTLAGDTGANSFDISHAVKKFISSNSPIVGGNRSNMSRTDNTSFHTAYASRSHRDSAVLDTIGILPPQAAFPRTTTGGRRATRVCIGDGSVDSAEIHHIRDWQLDQNDYCLDPYLEHNLPQKPKKTYSRISIDSTASPGLLPDSGNGRRISQVDSIGSALSPTDFVKDRIIEADEENGGSAEDTADQFRDRVMSHEEWKKSGGYV
ncbi:hypothetical protein TWF694_002819 [Orbilia ellipsospora]|uniref:Rhodopsin domain-containing protein n=1 Tax=Orbilia ellipsospora TaxID=2528407 RepID=A0AAV9X0V4_9PEZI